MHFDKIIDNMKQQRDENLMLVTAVELYAKKYSIPTLIKLI